MLNQIAAMTSLSDLTQGLFFRTFISVKKKIIFISCFKRALAGPEWLYARVLCAIITLINYAFLQYLSVVYKGKRMKDCTQSFDREIKADKDTPGAVII